MPNTSIRTDHPGDHGLSAAEIRPFIKPSILELWFRSLRLSMVWNACRRASPWSGTELPKQAVQKGRLVGVSSLVAAHLLPFAAAVLLIFLNVHSYYIGGELAGPIGHDDVKLSGLQFASKLHELTMQASLSVVVIGLIRQELVAGEGIPFGAIFGSLQFSNFSYLFSKEFVGTLRAKFMKRVIKVRLIILLLIGTVLALTVGPSSAIAMRPRLDNWPAGGTDFYLNATVDEIWPSIVDATSIPSSCNNVTVDTTCISRDWQFALDQLLAYWPKLTDRATMPESLQINSPESIRLMYTRQTQGLYTSIETLATTQMSNLADSLAEVGRLWAIAASELENVSPHRPRKFRYRNDAIYTLQDVYQPITTAKCWAHRNNAQLQAMLSTNTIEFPIAASLCNETTSRAPYSIQSEQSAMIAGFLDESATSPDLQFVELPLESFGNNTIGALITLPPSWPGGSNLLTCAVDARWTNVTLSSTRNVMKVVTGQPLDWPGHGLCNSFLSSINITSEWAQYLNPYIQDSNKTVFHTLVENVIVQASKWKNDNSFFQNLTESILTIMITNGLSRIASSATMQGQLNDCPHNDCNEICGRWCLDMMPKPDQVFGHGGNIYNLSGIPDLSKLSKFTVHVDVNGYAYSMRGATVYLSCVVLISYCLLVGVHFAFVVIKNTSSNAWDSVSEVTALAMQSQPTEVLRNTSAGISTTKLFSHLVKVVRTGVDKDHLELDFGDHPGYGERLVEDDFYD